ncbi:MAG: hypothetical protein AABZ32_01705, partial [Bacteroidota bacterium]
MKYFVILLILIVFAIFVSINNIYAIPPLDSRITYDFSDVIILGKVISVNSTFSPTHNLYQIKAEKFIKNQQDSDIVFASGQKTVNTRSGNSVFSVNDRGLFYLSNDTMKYDRYYGIFRVLPESRLIEPEWDKCNIFENDIPQEHWILGGVEPTPKIFQERNSDIENIKNNELVIISHDVSNISNTKQEFDLDGILSRSNGTGFETMSNMSQHVVLEPCTVFKTIEWRFTPGMTGSYLFEINGSNSGTSYGIGFTVKESIISSPLKQFKSGISVDKITCKENLQLIIKNNGNPACVKPDTIPKLVERNAIKLSSFYKSRPLIERLHVAMTIIQFSDIPTTILGLDHDQILGIEINDEE